MRKIVFPIIAYSVLSAVYLGLSGAPTRVHVWSLLIFALAFLAPSIWAAHVTGREYRVMVCGLFAIAAMLLWDASAPLVILKAEPLRILLGHAWFYLFALVMLVPLSFGMAWIAAPPRARA